MKDGYRYIDGKLEITDYSDNGVRELEYRHYQDNIDEVLITENTIEQLSKLKDEKEKKLEKIKEEISNCGITNFYIWGCIILLTFFLGGAGSIILKLTLGIKPLLTFLGTFIIISLIGNKFGFSVIKEELKELNISINGEKLVLDAIKEEITRNKKILKTLKNNMTRDREDKIKTDTSYKQISYVEKLEQLEKELALYYYVGAYENEMIQSYQNNTLEEQGFEKEEVKVLKRILEKKINQETK